MSIGGELQAFRLRVRGDDPLAHPFDERGFVLAPEGVKSAVLAHLRSLKSVRSLAPLLLEIRVRWHTHLPGEERDDALRDVPPLLGEAPVELKGLQQNGEVETPGAA